MHGILRSYDDRKSANEDMKPSLLNELFNFDVLIALEFQLMNEVIFSNCTKWKPTAIFIYTKLSMQNYVYNPDKKIEKSGSIGI